MFDLNIMIEKMARLGNKKVWTTTYKNKKNLKMYCKKSLKCVARRLLGVFKVKSREVGRSMWLRSIKEGEIK